MPINPARRRFIKFGAVATTLLSAAAPAATLARSVAAAKNGAGTDGYVDVGVMLRYHLSRRAGPPMVLLHEMGMNHEAWADVAAGLERDHTVLRYDLRGFGRSEKFTGSVTFDDHINDLTALLAATGLTGPVVLVGAALGGALALKFAVAHPGKVRAVVALSPALGAVSGKPATANPSADAMVRDGPRAWVMPRMADPEFDKMKINPRRFADFVGWNLANDPHSWAATMRMVSAATFADVYGQVRCPVLMVGAGGFQGRPVASIQAAAAQIPRGEFLLLNAGHFMAYDSPELVVPAIRKYMSRV
ncbi:alpha/beta fold hydrolase [Novosphingobium sp. BL-52-GroH]|uniref:alpha/beta fold hydrolase n=1 Tax=Novosphingobium sp. BL-52-GroH TaxID=3349877 RepID=UPI00384AD6DA